ncbi:MAG TPA: DUF3592 domain-containing protein [Pyrinomonadaceae bacterium]
MNWENLIAGLFALLIGVVGLFTGLKQLRNRSALRGWKRTNGFVIERGTYVPEFAMVSVPAYRHAPLVRYRYEVDGKEFLSSSITPDRIQLPQHNTLAWATRKAASFPDEVVVRYNPEDPGESYLVLTPTWLLIVVVVASCLVLLIGLVFLLSAGF